MQRVSLLSNFVEHSTTLGGFFLQVCDSLKCKRSPLCGPPKLRQIVRSGQVLLTDNRIVVTHFSPAPVNRLYIYIYGMPLLLLFCVENLSSGFARIGIFRTSPIKNRIGSFLYFRFVVTKVVKRSFTYLFVLLSKIEFICLNENC